MSLKYTSKEIADQLIHWLREYAALRIDSLLIDSQGCFPPHIYFDFGKKGFFGLHVSRKYGGLELETSDMLRVIEQIAAIDLTLCTVVIECVQGAHTLEKYASKSMKNRYLPELAEGRIFTAGAMTESGAGSNPRAMKSVAIPDNKHGWLLKGSKRWVGMGSSADVIAVYVQQLDADNNWLGMSGFLVPQGAEGLEIGPESPTMGLRGFSKNTIHMDNIKVTSEHLLGKIGNGMEIAQDNMMYIRLCLAAASIGTMKHCVQLMYRYAERRTIATGRLAENPVTMVRLSEMTAIVDALDNFVYLVSRFFDKDPSHVPEEMLVVAKVLGSEYLGMTADNLVQMLGARGYEEASGVSKIFRDVRAFRIFEGPSEALLMYIGSRILEENTCLDFFVREILQEPQLFDEIKFAVNQVNAHCLANKNSSFSKQFTKHYWAQSLVGEILAYGLVLCGLEYSIKVGATDDLLRAREWTRNKYNNVVQSALTGLLGEKVLLKSSQLKELIYKYTDAIGNIEQSRKTQDVFIDCLLTNNQQVDTHESGSLVEHESYQSENLEKEEAAEDGKVVATEAERQQLLHEWNNVENGVIRPDIGVHHLFEEQAIKTPESIALVYQEESITYHELNARANRVAHFLKTKGVTRNILVAIYMERSLEMIIGLLGILKAGGGYLPLDPHYPKEAIQFMFNDSECKMILSHKRLKKSIPFEAKQVLFYEDISSDSNPDTLASQMSTDDMFYVIYTSGSSGQPKGVVLPHKALANLIMWHRENISEKRNVLQFTSLNFDMSILEIFSALSSGGTLTLISEQERMDLCKLAAIIKNNGVQQLMIPVSFLKSLTATNVDKNHFDGIKEIIVAGEQVTVTQEMLSFFNYCKSCRLLNYYGPSETHVVTAYKFPKKTDDWPAYPPIGQSISNTKIMILNDEMRIVPIGTLGEIYIGGVALAKGYLNRDSLTKERFIDDPWGDSQGEKLYKTGDYGKYLPDGNILFIGRKDNQIKIRGFRIELQEIEANLTKFPGIEEAVVIVKNGIIGDKYLEAFLVINSAHKNDLFDGISTFLKDKLPPQMIPSTFHVIDKMPLTSSGKINRIALENFEKDSINYSRNFSHIAHATTSTEKILVEIMEDFFKIHVGINYSFTSIGGNSLLAMQIVSKIRDKFSVDLPAYSVLSDPSIADTAKRIDALVKTMRS